tara:strand:+ start:934 stop:1116 length:183 start_codon:yes stop_codon:yes gene_type:complete
MLSQYPAFKDKPELARQYELFCRARDRAADPDIITMWRLRVDQTINRAYALDQITARRKP